MFLRRRRGQIISLSLFFSLDFILFYPFIETDGGIHKRTTLGLWFSFIVLSSEEFTLFVFLFTLNVSSFLLLISSFQRFKCFIPMLAIHARTLFFLFRQQIVLFCHTTVLWCWAFYRKWVSRTKRESMFDLEWMVLHWNRNLPFLKFRF